jgi:hypothetical protein
MCLQFISWMDYICVNTHTYVIYTHNGILVSLQREGNSLIFDSMDEARGIMWGGMSQSQKDTCHTFPLTHGL